MLEITFPGVKHIKSHNQFRARSIGISENKEELASFDLMIAPVVPTAELLKRSRFARHRMIPDDDENLAVLEFVFADTYNAEVHNELFVFLFRWLRQVGADVNSGSEELRKLWDTATLTDAKAVSEAFLSGLAKRDKNKGTSDAT